MAAPSYTTDLSLIHACDAANASWSEPTGFTVGGITLPETDFFIHNTGCLSKNQQTTGGNGAIFNMGSGQTVPTDGAFFAWIIFSAPNALAAESSGGMQMFVGSATSAFKQFYVRGSDTYPYGGWVCIPVNPNIDSQNQTITVNATNRTFTRSTGSFVTDGFEPGMVITTTGFTNAGNNTTKIIESVATTVITVTSGTGLVTETPGGGDERIRFCDAVTGTPSTTLQYFGAGVSCPTFAPTKGQAFGLDICRFGRGEARFASGDLANGYCTFAGYAATNDSLANRYGLIQAVSGGYLWQGLMTLGYGGAVDFRDSNTMVMIANTKRVTSNFNKIEIKNASSRVDWTNISFLALGTMSKGRLEVVDDCDVNISYCTFTDMDTFIFKASSDVLNCTFRRCNTITANDAKFAGSLFDVSSVAADTSQLIWNVNTDPSSDLTSCTFVKGANAHHAIEFGTSSPTSMTLTNVTLTGFNASNGQNDSAVHIKRTAGTVTLTITGGTSPSYKTDGATVVIVTSSRTIKAIAQKADGTKVASAMVLLRTAATAAGGFPYDATVTITNSGTTATVTHNSHGMATNDKVQITGASLSANNGVFIITKVDDNSYTYTMSSSPGSSPTGTIKCTYVFLSGTTNGSGEISMSRAIGGNQSVIGWARKASDYLKQGSIAGTVVTTGDSTFTAILAPDS